MANMDNSATILFSATSDAIRTDSTGSARRPIYAEFGATTDAVRPEKDGYGSKYAAFLLRELEEGTRIRTNLQSHITGLEGLLDERRERERARRHDEAETSRLLLKKAVAGAEELHLSKIAEAARHLTDLQGQLDDRVRKEAEIEHGFEQVQRELESSRRQVEEGQQVIQNLQS